MGFVWDERVAELGEVSTAVYPNGFQDLMVYEGMNAYIEPTLGTIWAPDWMTSGNIEAALHEAFRGAIPQEARAHIHIAWPDRGMRTFNITGFFRRRIRYINIEEGEILDDFQEGVDAPEEATERSTSDAAIEPLRERRITVEDEGPICGICQDDKAIGETVIELPCACMMVYDTDCIEYRLRSNQNCPSCRRSIHTGRLIEGYDQDTPTSGADLEQEVEAPEEILAEIVNRAIMEIMAPFQTVEHTRTPFGRYHLRPSRNPYGGNGL